MRIQDELGDRSAKLVYATEDEAFHRVNQLRQRGMWPGVRRMPGGFYQLTHDPAIRIGEENA